MSNVPKRFVGLHNHSGASAYDGLGLPQEQFEFCMENGLDAHAITEHGHFNSYAHAQLWVEDWKKSNKEKKFKYLPGIEAYFHPDLEVWKQDKLDADEAKTNKALAKKLKQKNETQMTVVDRTDGEDETLDIEMTNALTIENEDETKTVSKFVNPVNRRHHLVLLPKNDKGLQELFHLTSRGFLEGFYRFPRIDTRMVRETLTKGNVVALGACVGGLPSWEVFRKLAHRTFDALDASLLNDPAIMDDCVAAVGNAYEMMTSAFGKDDYYLELQFNKLGAQDVANRAMLEFARRNGLTDKLIVTCDAHYPRPELWRDREIYKKLGFMNYSNFSPDSLPNSVDELKCELYPKNASQVWNEYLKSAERNSFYNDGNTSQVIADAIERSYDVAHSIIGEVKPDRSIKLPKKLVPPDQTPIEKLTWMCIDGIKKRGLKGKPEYIERLKYELDVIEKQGMAEYFITLARIIELGREVVLFGPGRGSGGGSLVNYLTYIIDLDPIKWDLPFERFMSLHRCLDPETRVLMDDETSKCLKDIQVGDCVKTQDGSSQRVMNRLVSKHEKVFHIKVNGMTFKCSADHVWVVVGPDGKPMNKSTSDLTVDDVMYTYQCDNSTKNL